MEIKTRILQVLESGDHRKGELYTLGDNPAEVDDALEALADEGLVRRKGRMGPARYSITAKGRKQLKQSPAASSVKLLPAITADRRLVLISIGAGDLVQIIGREDTAAIDELLKKAA